MAPTTKTTSAKCVGFFQSHSLSLVTIAILGLWIVLYSRSDPEKHVGEFY
jgi:hypothetical protein